MIPLTELHLFRFGLLRQFVYSCLEVYCSNGDVFSYQGKVKVSLKQFFIDLNDSLWFIGSVIRTFIVSPGMLHDSEIKTYARLSVG